MGWVGCGAQAVRDARHHQQQDPLCVWLHHLPRRGRRAPTCACGHRRMVGGAQGQEHPRDRRLLHAAQRHQPTVSTVLAASAPQWPAAAAAAALRTPRRRSPPIPHRRADHTYDPLDGARSSQSYIMLSPDQIARRGLSCWCEGCFGARGRTNMLSSGNKLICQGCTHRDKPSWVQQTARDLGTGLAGRRKARRTCLALRPPLPRRTCLAALLTAVHCTRRVSGGAG